MSRSLGCSGSRYEIPAATYSPVHSGTVPSALRGLTSVFGMGTGVSPSLWRPEGFEFCDWDFSIDNWGKIFN